MGKSEQIQFIKAIQNREVLHWSPKKKKRPVFSITDFFRHAQIKSQHEDIFRKRGKDLVQISEEDIKFLKRKKDFLFQQHFLFRRLHRSYPQIKKVAQLFESALFCDCKVNAYLTPPSDQTFRIHYDRHDVLIYQQEGSKKWSIYPQIDHPHETRDYFLKPTLNFPAHLKPQKTLTLNPGEFLFIPKGVPHAAESTAENHSLHLTIGLFHYTLFDLIEFAAFEKLRALSEQPELNIPLNQPQKLPRKKVERLIHDVFEDQKIHLDIQKAKAFRDMMKRKIKYTL